MMYVPGNGRGSVRPGGRLLGEGTSTPLSERASVLDLPTSVLQMSKDPEFYREFVIKVPDLVEQEKFLLNTAAFITESSFDPAFVLLFRRTLPSAAPKPETHWSSNFVTVRNGLKTEIPEGPHRLHSVILCATLRELLQAGRIRPEIESRGISDGEVRFTMQNFLQTHALVIFKPACETEALSEYLKQPGAKQLSQILAEVASSKIK